MDLTTKQVAAQLGITPRRVRQYIKSGRLKAKKIGRDYIVSSRQLDAFTPRPPGRPTSKEQS